DYYCSSFAGHKRLF
nr:immunoglobulin light chain junction region [Macaca mulatta]MOV94875.1 immunoglobulin light chain junction region [Macaca mulatta]MOV95464.1 immunoglobulin light chain junction region [Macaca mulatta]MOV96263.1 immunoglobulin light chain junction region [Macaca mulatta]MOV96437.1 immunoglobulin light chain junction region [Macaca mulatta]